jgi:hypothetical protein
MKTENGYRFEKYVRIERVSKKSGKTYKQWVFVGWMGATFEELNAGTRKGDFILIQEGAELVRYAVSPDELCDMHMETLGFEIQEISEVASDFETVRTTEERRCNDCGFKIPSHAFCFRYRKTTALCTRCGLKRQNNAPLTEREKQAIITLSEYLGTFKGGVDSRTIKAAVESRPNVYREVFKSKAVRRNLKKLMKEELSRFDDPRYKKPPVELVSRWRNVEESGETALKVWIFKGVSIEKARRLLGDTMGEPIDGVNIHSAYDCTGQWFAWEADFKQLGDRVFVTQHWGLDC